MNRTRRPLAVLFCTVLLLLGSILVPIPANATSAYDDVIKPVSSLRLKKNNSDLVNITTSYGYDIYNADATAYGHFHDCVTSSTCRYALVQEVDNAAQTYYKHQGTVIFIYSMDGVGSVSFDNDGPFGSPEAKLSRSSGSFSYIQLMLKDDWSSTDRVVGESSLSEFPLANTRPTSGMCSDLWSPWPDYYCGITNDLGHQGTQPLLSTFPVTYPPGYDGEEIPTQAAHAKYVAMGDSFSSGEGNEPFEAGTAYSGINECHRSPHAYPRLLEADSNLDLGSTAFVSCSGATTSSVLYGNSGTGNWGEGPQVDALSEDTEVVTITIGGNDLGFSQVMGACAYSPRNTDGWGCSTSTSLNSDLSTRLAALAGEGSATIDGKDIYSIKEVIEAIAEVAPDASIYIAGYPHLFGSDADDFDANIDAPSGSSCEVWLAASYDYDDAQWINDGVDALNLIIQTAVGDAQNEAIDVTYVSPGLFAGHANCDSDESWIYPVFITDPPTFAVTPQSFHPNDLGQSTGYKPAFEAYLS